jgi:maltooligosyltrehalose trehalohydrolase
LRRDLADLADADLTKVAVDFDEDERWLVLHRGEHRVVANLSSEERTVPVSAAEVVLATDEARPDGDRLVLAPESAAIVRAA